MQPYLSDPDVELHCGDAYEVLRELPSGSVHMAATSPPFFGLIARQLGRHVIGIELNERYCAMTRARLSQLSLLSEPAAERAGQ